ncbi:MULTISPECIES: DUF6900 domain-containing protein [Enterococcus]|nr:hypothetical protein [Enterococcus faecalis]
MVNKRKIYNSDHKDFLDIAVWCLEDALIAAYEQGKKDGIIPKE